jgi:hypothetical protein
MVFRTYLIAELCAALFSGGAGQVGGILEKIPPPCPLKNFACVTAQFRV